MTTPTDPHLTAPMAAMLARRLEDDPDTLAFVLRRYRQHEHLDEGGLAAYLGMPAEQLPYLALCGRPREGLFREDVETVAGRFGIESWRLAEVVREVDVQTAWERPIDLAGRTGMLAAARDRAAEEGETYVADGDPDDDGTDDDVAAEQRPDAEDEP